MCIRDRLKEVNKDLQANMDQAANDLQTLLYTIPNVPYDSVPEGVGADDNVGEKIGCLLYTSRCV